MKPLAPSFGGLPRSVSVILMRWRSNLVAVCAACALLSNPLPANSAEIRGQVVDIFTREPLEGVRVEVPGIGASHSNEKGEFNLALGSAMGTQEIRASKAGYYPRVTWLLPGGGQDFDLIPKKSGFDLEFFDMAFRWAAPGGPNQLTDIGTMRWVTQPQFLVASRLVDCGCLKAEGNCTRRSESCKFTIKVPKYLLREAKRLLRENAPLLSGGFVKASKIRTMPVPKGEYKREDFFDLPRNVILIILGRPGGLTFVRLREDGKIYNGAYSAWVYWNRFLGRFVHGSALLHELAHTLGYSHPLSYYRFPLPTIMGACRGDPDVPSNADVLHGYVLYSRPASSTSPDVDPKPQGPQPSRGQKTRLIIWDDSRLLRDRQALYRTQGVGDANLSDSSKVFSGSIGPGDESCETSLGRPCVSHSFSVDRQVEGEIVLKWSSTENDLDFQLHYRDAGWLLPVQTRNDCYRRVKAKESARGPIGPGDYEVRVIYWSGESRERYNLKVRVP